MPETSGPPLSQSTAPGSAGQGSRSSLGRRRLLTLAGAGAVGAVGGLHAIGPALADSRTATRASRAAPPAGGQSLSFAVVTDTHATPTEPARLDILRRTFASIASASPTFVLNCGDITDHSGEDEYAAYLSTIPDSLRGRIRHVPGNHEVRWDVNAKQLYHRLFGPTPYSWDVGGLHLVGLDPTQTLQEPGHFGRELLDWLAADLRTAGPSVLFLHYPLGSEHYYVNDQDAFFETIAHLPVRAVFAGHIHREHVVRTNGFTQLAGPAVRNGANYYWVERGDDAQHTVLRVWMVTVAEDGTETRREVTTIPLTGRDEDQHLRPVRIDVGAPAPTGKIPVTVRLRGSSTAASVRAQVYPQHVFGGGNAGSWVELTPTPQGWRGTVDADAMAAGVHRLQVRVADERGASYDATELFTISSTGPAPVERWQARMTGSIQGALAERDGLVVAATTKGHVEAFRPERRRRRVVWRSHVGPVYRGPAFTLDGATLVVPSADHHLYVLDAGTGQVQQRLRLAGPVLSSPLVTTVDETETVFVTAGTTLYAIDPRAVRIRWSADLHGLFAGRPACDGERVYAGSGDGNAYAFDAANGALVWSVSMTTREDPHGRLLYGPWDDVVTLLPDGAVLFSTVSTATALDRATGSQRWSASGGFLYPPARLTDQGLLLVDEWGKAQLVDPASGTATWVTELGVRVFNAGPVLRAGQVWIVAATGLLSGIDLATGEVRHQRQLGPGNTFSTPALVGDLLITADQDGLLRGVELPA